VAKAEPPKMVKALYDYEGEPCEPAACRTPLLTFVCAAQSEDEITFKQGDILSVVGTGDEPDEGWWKGRVTESQAGTKIGSEGLFPSNYVAPV
jgi:hypothetical protein